MNEFINDSSEEIFRYKRRKVNEDEWKSVCGDEVFENCSLYKCVCGYFLTLLLSELSQLPISMKYTKVNG